MHAFEQTVRASLLAAGLRPGDPLAVACSHGPDSLALAEAVLRLRRPLKLGPVMLVYVHHGLRPEADAEEAAVCALARSRECDFLAPHVTVDRGRGMGLEEAARAARYAALDAIDPSGARFVLLGHTASDQAETILLRLLRGAGVAGLAGIPPRRGRYLRPILTLPRSDVEAYLAARGLTPSQDASNDDPSHRRNRIRHELLPALRAENPSADLALARAAAALREVDDAIEWAAERALADLGPSIDCTRLGALPDAVAKRVLQRLGIPDALHLDAVLELCRRPRAGTVELSVPGLVVKRVSDLLEIRLKMQNSVLP